jgi:hypothetical protein
VCLCRLRHHYKQRPLIYIELERLLESYRSGDLTLEDVARDARGILDEKPVRVVSVRDVNRRGACVICTVRFACCVRVWE